jgi:hypothetical protein
MFTKEPVGKYHASRTIEYQFERIADTLHFIINAFSDLQQLRGCHPNFLLRQFIQSPQRILDVRFSQ